MGKNKGKAEVPAALKGTTAAGSGTAKATSKAEKNIANIEREGVEASAAKAATPPKAPAAPKTKAPDTPDAPKTKAPEGTPAAAADGAKPTLSGMLEKYRSGTPFSAAEKAHAKIQAAKGVVGYRMIMGKGAVSGGEGLI
jgi:hypothetical protein